MRNHSLLLLLIPLSLASHACGTKKTAKSAQGDQGIPFDANVVTSAELGIRFPIKVAGNTLEVTHEHVHGITMSHSRPIDQQLIDYCGFSIEKGVYAIVPEGTGVKLVPTFVSKDPHNLLNSLEFSFTEDGTQLLPTTQKALGNHAWLFSQIFLLQVANGKGQFRDAADHGKMALTSDDQSMAIWRHCSRQAAAHG